MSDTDNTKSASKKRFGTFNGVFVTNVLTIFGVILFYREGWVIGNAGFLGALSIIVIANCITLATSFSISSIATNINVKEGGSYFIISRSLGPEIGGAMGIVLFFAQSFSIAFYIIGFTQPFKIFFPDSTSILLDQRVLGTIVLLLIALLTFFNTSIAIKSQYFVFAMIMIAIAVFAAGNVRFDVKPTMWGEFSQGNFLKTFAIYFPAVTGILSGVSLSGDLKDPRKNIPNGTILSVLFTFVIYLLVAVIFACNIDMGTLLNNENVMIDTAVKIVTFNIGDGRSVSLGPSLVIAGILAATLSSAIGSLLSGPRTLQSLAMDHIIPHFFAKGSGRTEEPRRATIVSMVFAETLLLIGNVNFVAQLLTMFFLATYGMLNIIVFFESIVQSPTYRPSFRVHWSVSLFGAISCFAVMFLINKLQTIVAVIIILTIYLLLTRRDFDINWGDLRKRLWAFFIEVGIEHYDKYAEHPRNWRPNISIFENNPDNRMYLIEMASLIAGNSGITSQYLFIDEYLDDIYKTLDAQLAEAKNYIRDNHYKNIYPELIVTNKDKHAHILALQADGKGSFKSNLIISDIDFDTNNYMLHFHNLASYEHLKKSVIFLKKNTAATSVYNREDRIDIWLSGFQQNVSLMMLIPFLIKKNKGWKKTRIVIKMIVRDDESYEKAEKNLAMLAKYSRIKAEVEIIELEHSEQQHQSSLMDKIGDNKMLSLFMKNDRLRSLISNIEQKKYSNEDRPKIGSIIRESSANARLVILGLNVPDPGKEEEYAESVKRLTDGLPQTLLIRSAISVSVFK